MKLVLNVPFCRVMAYKITPIRLSVAKWLLSVISYLFRLETNVEKKRG